MERPLEIPRGIYFIKTVNWLAALALLIFSLASLIYFAVAAAGQLTVEGGGWRPALTIMFVGILFGALFLAPAALLRFLNGNLNCPGQRTRTGQIVAAVTGLFFLPPFGLLLYGGVLYLLFRNPHVREFLKPARLSDGTAPAGCPEAARDETPQT